MSEAHGVWTSEEVALILIDYQKEMFENVKSETTPDEIDLNVRFLIRAAKAFNIPVVLSSVGVTMGVNGPTRASITDELPGLEAIDCCVPGRCREDGQKAADLRGALY